MYKLDRNAFSMHSLESKEPASAYWKNKTPEERLRAAFYLNSVAYNFNISDPPKMNRTVFSMRRHQS